MIDKIEISTYRKLNNISIDLSKRITFISGTNGTCKSSILYIISNAFQRVNRNSTRLKDSNVVSVINDINNGLNLKIERLTRGDDKYNDPAVGKTGTLYNCHYENGYVLGFRRHNTSENNRNRYSLKPKYKRGSGDSLPDVPVIYLGLSRLYSFGEYNNDDLKRVSKKLPSSYSQVVRDSYKKFTGLTISDEEVEAMGYIKKRSKFYSDTKGVDSNTISAGEDNLLIILTALVSLRYYYENIDLTRETESILLVDEMDATLHPAYQMKLLDLIIKYTKDYNIKLVSTTHSISLMEYALNKKCEVIYLIDNITSVRQMEDVDIYKIKMFLNNQIKDELYLNRSIPVFTEDEEARNFLNHIFDFFERAKPNIFTKVRGLFHLVNANVSSSALTSIFSDDKLLRSTMRSICILDGDMDVQKNISCYTICLPGGKSPEELIFEYSKELFEREEDEFWNDSTIEDLGFSKINYRDNILQDIERIQEKIDKYEEEGKSTKGVRRTENKKVYNKHLRFFDMVSKRWIQEHKGECMNFYKDLKVMFCKVSEFHDISNKEWAD
ncbi:AAA family ATPase [Lachnospiraceae bacterium OttesenSCG-928-J05]|nr:AAA family ATPase [Lachnospiraceae bacterium OttesenSCG-928-J05]